MAIEYRKEFFDRTYTAREAYARVWRYARKYRFRIFTGILCGMNENGDVIVDVNGAEKTFPAAAVSKVRTVFDF